MAEVGYGSMGSPPEIKYLPTTTNADGSVLVDLSSLPSSENPDTISASVNIVAEYCKKENKELRVKVPTEYFSFIAPLRQMGFDRIQDGGDKYIVLENENLQVAPNGTPMQRENIASSSNPCKLVCSQTPGGATSAVAQTPSQTACASDGKLVAAGSGDTRVEQDPGFQRAFPSDPAAGIGNDEEAAGLQGFSAGCKRPAKGSRASNITDKEKGLLLRSKLGWLRVPANQRQSQAWLLPVSRKLKDRGCVRKPNTWRGRFETLTKNLDAVKREFPEGINVYWDLTDEEKKVIKKNNPHFPLTFEREWVDAMEEIWKIKPRRPTRNRSRRDGQEEAVTQSPASTMTDSANFRASEQQPREASAQGSDEDNFWLENRRTPPRIPLADMLDELVSSSHMQWEEDNHLIFDTIKEQVAVDRELSSFSLEVFDYAGSSAQNALLGSANNADQAGINELENQEELR